MSAQGHTPESPRGADANGGASARAGSAPASSAPLILHFSPYELDFSRHELRREGAPVALQPTPLRVLLYLAEHRDRTVPRRELLDAIWPGVVVGDEALTTALAESRHAVGDDGAAQRVIRTLKGAGYRFVAEAVEESSAADQALARSRRRLWIAASAGGVALAAIAAALALRPAPEPAPVPLGIAVLPLSIVAGNAEDQALAHGLTEQIATTLSRNGYPVVAQASAAQWTRAADVRALGETLEVSHVLEGSVQRSDSRVHVTMQLADAQTGLAIWSETLEPADGDRFAIQATVANQIAAQVAKFVWEDAVALRRYPELAQISMRFAEVRGIGLQQRFDDQLAGADRILSSVPAREPYLRLRGSAHGMISMAWGQAYTYDHRPFREAGPQMLSHAEAAVRLAPDDAFAHGALARALVHHWRWEEAERATRRACELAPGSAYPCGINWGRLCAALGCVEQQLAAGRVVRDQLPDLLHYSWALLHADRLAEAETESLRVRELSEGSGGILLSLLQWQLGKRSEAIESLRRHASAAEAHEFAREIERANAEGPEAAWRRAADLLASRDPSTLADPRAQFMFVPLCEAAMRYAGLGEIELGLRALERSEAEHEPCLEQTGVSALWDPLRNTPLFEALIEKMGLTPYHAKYFAGARRNRLAAGPTANQTVAP